MKNLNSSELFKRIIHTQEKHITFLDSTQRNLAYYLFGKNVDLYKRLTIPRINVCSIMNASSPQPDNPLQSIVGAFIDELSVSEFRTTVRPYPVEGKEPYDSYSDMLEQQLTLIHKNSYRRTQLRSAAFELMAHGYFGVYFDGIRYYFLTAYDLIPGDPNIVETQAQPFIIRKTQVNKATLEAAGIDTSEEQNISFQEWNQNDDLEMFTLYDVYVKQSDQNIGFTQKGTVVYDQRMARPKRYPIAIANTSEILSSFYTVPIMTQLVEKLIDYQKANASIKESSSSIAKPILTYDSDAGIDVDALHRALKMGYKHIIVGKNKEGDIQFKAPGSLPNYAQQLPDKIEEDIMKHLGLNKTFMGLPSVGARERGALARLLKTSFRKLSSISQVIESTFEELDQYIIDYMSEHKITCEKETGLNIEQIFAGPIRYVPEERFVAYSTEDSLEKKSFILNKWRSKLIPTKKALEEMGEVSPSKIIEAMMEEQKKNTEFATEMAKVAQTLQTKTNIEKVSNKLKGELEYRFWLTPIAEDKVLIKCHASEIERVAFILSDISNIVRIETYVEDIPAPLDQLEPKVPVTEPVIPVQPNAGEQSENPNQPAVNQPSSNQPSPNQPATNQSPIDSNKPQESLPVESAKENSKEDSPLSSTISKPVETNEVETFNPAMIEEYLSKSQTIYDDKKYKDLQGMYITEPHSRWISIGKKLALVTATDYSSNLERPYLFAGKEVYGVIILKKMFDPTNFDFIKSRRYHIVTDKERKKWWGDRPLYLYLFEFYPFKFPMQYVRTPGQTTFFGNVEFIEDVTEPDSTDNSDLDFQAKENQIAKDKINNTPEKSETINKT